MLRILVIQNHQIIANDSPENLYQNPQIKYVATLFDDVNEIFLNNKTHLLYPNQIKIVEKSELKAMVLNSYFKGSFWLIEADFQNRKVYINNASNLKKGLKISLLFEL